MNKHLEFKISNFSVTPSRDKQTPRNSLQLSEILALTRFEASICDLRLTI